MPDALPAGAHGRAGAGYQMDIAGPAAVTHDPELNQKDWIRFREKIYEKDRNGSAAGTTG